ncbi:MAG: helicase [Vampirovibrionales bacterium]|nr:helicase [Vampirovibrionales bacterium]
MTEAWAKDDAMATYHEACRLAADGHEGVREWFGGAKSKYAAFLDSKRPAHVATGLTRTPELADWLLPIQAATAEFALHRGRAGAFLSTGLGKTGVQLEFSRHAADATNGRALILTPLAVAMQFEREGTSRGYDARVIRSMADVRDGLSICNYDRIEKIDPDAFGSVCIDEGSAIKAFGGKTTRLLTSAFAGHRFRLSATATPAPNDHMELGTQSEFLGVLDYREMLSRWFVNDTSTASQKWRLKGHAVSAFWDWVASWARMAVMPSDMGFSDDGYELPPLKIIRHKPAIAAIKPKDGELFAAATSATSMFAAKRQTSDARADLVAGLVHGEPGEAWVCWCNTDDEAKKLMARIPGAVEVRGSMRIEDKESAIAAFIDRQARVLVTKPGICGHGLNLQHCARTAFIGRTFSYEEWFQAVKRFHRFGQKREVHAHLIVDESERQADDVLARKEADHKRMQAEMAAAMARNRSASSCAMAEYTPTHYGRLPSWIAR